MRLSLQFIDVPTEQTTAITDAMLAVLALIAIASLRQLGQHAPLKASLWSWAFGLLALAAVLGTVAHGFKLSEAVKAMVWRPLNLSLGLLVAVFVVAAILDVWGPVAARRALPIMLAVGVAFFGVTLLLPGSFRVFLVYEAAAMLLALAGYLWLAAGGRLEGGWLMVAGILVTMIAAGVQASSLSITVIWPFDHNGIYHLIQMAGVVLLLAGLRTSLLALA